MSKIILVTGGARSGKSGFAESLCREQNNSTAYIATSVAFDDEMKERVRKHQESRPKEWKTYEIYKDIYKIIKELGEKHQTVILDCITLLVNNLMFTDGIDIDNASEEEINEVLDVYKSNNREKIINEVGDLLFACVNVARLLNVDEEEALNKSTKKFVKRFNFIEESIVNQGKSLSESTIDEMNALWEDSKKYD